MPWGTPYRPPIKVRVPRSLLAAGGIATALAIGKTGAIGVPHMVGHKFAREHHGKTEGSLAERYLAPIPGMNSVEAGLLAGAGGAVGEWGAHALTGRTALGFRHPGPLTAGAVGRTALGAALGMGAFQGVMQIRRNQRIKEGKTVASGGSWTNQPRDQAGRFDAGGHTDPNPEGRPGLYLNSGVLPAVTVGTGLGLVGYGLGGVAGERIATRFARPGRLRRAHKIGHEWGALTGTTIGSVGGSMAAWRPRRNDARTYERDRGGQFARSAGGAVAGAAAGAGVIGAAGAASSRLEPSMERAATRYAARNMSAPGLDRGVLARNMGLRGSVQHFEAPAVESMAAAPEFGPGGRMTHSVYGPSNSTVLGHELGHARFNETRLGRGLGRLAGRGAGTIRLPDNPTVEDVERAMGQATRRQSMVPMGLMGAGIAGAALADPDSAVSKLSPVVAGLGGMPYFAHELAADVHATRGITRTLGARAGLRYAGASAPLLAAKSLAVALPAGAAFAARKVRQAVQGRRDGERRYKREQNGQFARNAAAAAATGAAVGAHRGLGALSDRMTAIPEQFNPADAPGLHRPINVQGMRQTLGIRAPLRIEFVKPENWAHSAGGIEPARRQFYKPTPDLAHNLRNEKSVIASLRSVLSGESPWRWQGQRGRNGDFPTFSKMHPPTGGVLAPRNSTILAHEIGHIKFEETPAGKAAMRAFKHERLTPGPWRALRYGGIATAAGADPDSAASKLAPWVTALSVAPPVVPEIGANYYAARGLGKIGQHSARRALIRGMPRQMASYLGPAMVPVGAAIAARQVRKALKRGEEREDGWFGQARDREGQFARGGGRGGKGKAKPKPKSRAREALKAIGGGLAEVGHGVGGLAAAGVEELGHVGAQAATAVGNETAHVVRSAVKGTTNRMTRPLLGEVVEPEPLVSLPAWARGDAERDQERDRLGRFARSAAGWAGGMGAGILGIKAHGAASQALDLGNRLTRPDMPSAGSSPTMQSVNEKNLFRDLSRAMGVNDVDHHVIERGHPAGAVFAPADGLATNVQRVGYAQAGLPLGERSRIYSPAGTTTLAHELGHARNFQSKPLRAIMLATARGYRGLRAINAPRSAIRSYLGNQALGFGTYAGLGGILVGTAAAARGTKKWLKNRKERRGDRREHHPVQNPGKPIGGFSAGRRRGANKDWQRLPLGTAVPGALALGGLGALYGYGATRLGTGVGKATRKNGGELAGATLGGALVPGLLLGPGAIPFGVAGGVSGFARSGKRSDGPLLPPRPPLLRGTPGWWRRFTGRDIYDPMLEMRKANRARERAALWEKLKDPRSTIMVPDPKSLLFGGAVVGGGLGLAQGPRRDASIDDLISQAEGGIDRGGWRTGGGKYGPKPPPLGRRVKLTRWLRGSWPGVVAGVGLVGAGVGAASLAHRGDASLAELIAQAEAVTRTGAGRAGELSMRAARAAQARAHRRLAPPPPPPPPLPKNGVPLRWPDTPPWRTPDTRQSLHWPPGFRQFGRRADAPGDVPPSAWTRLGEVMFARGPRVSIPLKFGTFRSTVGFQLTPIAGLGLAGAVAGGKLIESQLEKRNREREGRFRNGAHRMNEALAGNGPVKFRVNDPARPTPMAKRSKRKIVARADAWWSRSPKRFKVPRARFKPEPIPPLPSGQSSLGGFPSRTAVGVSGLLAGFGGSEYLRARANARTNRAERVNTEAWRPAEGNEPMAVSLDPETLHRLRNLHGTPGSVDLREYAQNWGG